VRPTRPIQPTMNRLAPLALLLAALLAIVVATAPLAAYTVVLKDGSTIVAKTKYQLQGDRAVITLPNGTQTFVRANQIDVARTEQANKIDYGTAVVLRGDPSSAAAPPPPAQGKRLSDLIARDQAVPRALPEIRRETRREAGPLGRTSSGSSDFASLPRKPFSPLEAASVLQQFFRGQQIEEVAIYQGTQAGRPLLEVTTNSEAAVFRALTVSSNALLHVRGTHPGIEALELLLVTPTKERAGQFVLTPQMAAELVAKKVEVSAFFLDHVQF
jgi:hypothetical protein